jgi:Zn-dependent protease
LSLVKRRQKVIRHNRTLDILSRDMVRSFQLAHVAAIRVKVHITFFVILIQGALIGALETNQVQGALFVVAFIALVFACIILRELGRVLTARCFDVKVHEVMLLPIGGIAAIGSTPLKPLHELAITMAGPLVNVVIAGLLTIGFGDSVPRSLLNGRLVPPELNSLSFDALPFWLLYANIGMLVFNLVPALPLEGGRILRACLAMMLGFVRATHIAAVIGQVLAIALIAVGVITGRLLLCATALLIYASATPERTYVGPILRKHQRIPKQVSEAYGRHALKMQHNDSLSMAAEYLHTSLQTDFAILRGTQLLGVVTRDEVKYALTVRPPDTGITEIMSQQVLKLHSTQTISEARDAMVDHSARIAAVYEGQSFLGLVNYDDLREAFALVKFETARRLRVDAFD